MRSLMLSNPCMWDSGTVGSLTGNYALNHCTRGSPGSFRVGIKRMTFRHAGPIRLENYFCFKPEAGDLRLGGAMSGLLAFCSIWKSEIKT